VNKILPHRGRWPAGPEGASTQTLMKRDFPRFLSGSPLTRFAGAPPEGEHLIALTLMLLLCACAPKAKPPATVALDCSQPFDALKTKITAQPGLVPAPQEPTEPYRAYSTADGHASYFITEPGAPAHPAILMQQAAGGAMTNTGCAYGDKAAYDQLTAYLMGLKAGRKRARPHAGLTPRRGSTT
jgi:hypothetical protein